MSDNLVQKIADPEANENPHSGDKNEYRPRFIPENTLIELPYTERGKLSVEIDELSDLEFNMLKEQVSITADVFLGIEQEHEKLMGSETYFPEKIQMNKKHTELVTAKAKEFAEMQTSKRYRYDSEGRLVGMKGINAALLGEAEHTKGETILPIDKKEARLVELAAMLHDIQKNKVFKSEEERLLWHHVWSAGSAKEILDVSGLNADDVEHVSQMILEHQPMPFVVARLNDAKQGSSELEEHRTNGNEITDGHIQDLSANNWVRAIKSVPSHADYESGKLDEEQKRIYEIWQQGSYEYQTSKGAAVLYAADLLSPAEMFDVNFFEEFVKSGEPDLKSYLENTGKEFDINEIAAGSFDRYVLINLGWGVPLNEAFASAHMSLRNNVVELVSSVNRVEQQQNQLTLEEYNQQMESAWVATTIGQSHGQLSLSRISESSDKVTQMLDETKQIESNLPEEEQVITKYESLLYESKKAGLSQDERKELQDKMEELRTKYIAKSMYILYASALPVFRDYDLES